MSHIATVSISTSSGSIGAHFSQYFGPRTFPNPLPAEPMGGWAFLDFPVGTDYRKLMSRDDEFGPRITPGNPWNQSVNFDGTGIYLLDLADWDFNPNAYVELKIDNVPVFKAHGTGISFRKDWNIHIRAANVRVTDAREIAIEIQA